MNIPVFRYSTPADREAILSFVERSGFNPRDAITWDGLNMLAMTAWVGDKLVGAIPMEPRVLQISAGRTIRSLHETVVAVEESYRGQGLGSRMQSAITQCPPAGAELITVFREAPESPAYRWYLKNEFSPLMHIESWFCDEPKLSDVAVEIWQASDPSVPWESFENERASGRIQRRLRDWLTIHPYRKQYSFWIVQGSGETLALLGVGKMHSQTLRADALDFVAGDPESMRLLLRAIETAAAKMGWLPVRVSLAEADPHISVVKALGYESRWSFDMLGRVISPSLDLKQVDLASWRYAAIDYI